MRRNRFAGWFVRVLVYLTPLELERLTSLVDSLRVIASGVGPSLMNSNQGLVALTQACADAGPALAHLAVALELADSGELKRRSGA